MYQTISEAVSVLGIFQNASFIPKKFKWQSRIYPIEAITSTHEIKDGNLSKRCYSVVCQGNLYLLIYNRFRETWILEQIWQEG